MYRLGASPHSWEGDLLAAHLWLGPASAVSHSSACALWELPGFQREGVELSTSVNRRSLPPVVVHRVRQDFLAHTTTVASIPVTNAGRSIVDIAGLVGPDDLEAVVEDAIRRRLTSRKHLLWLMNGRKTTAAQGFRVLRRLLSDNAEPSTESRFETRLLQAIRQAGLPLPVRQYEITDGDRFIARVDFAYPWAKLAIEADGYRYHSGREAWEADLERRGDITALGWLVIHVTYRQMVGDMAKVAQRIRAALSPALPLSPPRR